MFDYGFIDGLENPWIVEFGGQTIGWKHAEELPEPDAKKTELLTKADELIKQAQELREAAEKL